MPLSPILQLPEVIQSSPQFDQATNDALIGLECATNDILTIDMSAGNRNIGDIEQLRAFLYRCNNCSGQTITLSNKINILVEARRFIVVHNDSGSSGELNVALAGNVGFSDKILPNGSVLYYIKGTEIFILSRFGTTTSSPSLSYESSVFITDQPPSGEKQVMRVDMTQDISFFTNFGGSQGSSRISSAQATVFKILRNDVEVGNVTFNTNGSVQFTTSNPTSPVTFAAGQVLTITSSPLQDASLADVSVNLLGLKL